MEGLNVSKAPKTELNGLLALAGPRETISFYHAVALCVGVVVGAGIFRVPTIVAGASPSPAIFMGAWLAGGLLSIAGALCYAELAAAYPSAGGDYAFLRRAYGRSIAFLYGWARLSVIQTGSLAMLGYIFGDYLAAVWPLGPFGGPIYAGSLILTLTLLNWLGMRVGAGAQLWLTLLEIAGVCAVILAGFLVAPAAATDAAEQKGAVGLVLVFVLLSYGGWSEVVYVSAELRQARRRIPQVLIAGLSIVTLLYLLLNLALLRALGLEEIARSEAVASELMDRWLGPTGAALISLIVAIAAVTSANATAITGARSAYALGRDFPLLRWLGRWHGERGTPANALLLQGGLALLIIGASALNRHAFQSVVEYTAPVFWFFLLLVGLALFVLRRREPDADRPFRVPFYPVLPALFCATSAFLLFSSISYTGPAALIGLAVLAAGAALIPFLTRKYPESR